MTEFIANDRRRLLKGIGALAAAVLLLPKKTLAWANSESVDADLRGPENTVLVSGRLSRPTGVAVSSWSREELWVHYGYGFPTRIRPLSDFPELAVAPHPLTRTYDISEAGIFWPKLDVFIPASALEGDAWRECYMSWSDFKLFRTAADWDLKRPRSLAYGGGETTVVEDHRDFIISRGDDVLARHIRSYPALATADAEELVKYEITPEGLRFPGLSGEVVIPFPPAREDGFLLG